MSNRFKKTLPSMALVSAFVSLISMALLSHFRQPLVTDSGKTRSVAEAALAELQTLHPASLDDPSFRSAVEQAVHEPHVVTVWLIAPDGRFVYAVGCTAASTPSGGLAEELAGRETLDVLSTLPNEALSAEQRTMLLSSSAIRREGGHNDLFRHALRPVHDSDGRLVALVGVAYEASAANVGAVYIIVALVGLAGLGLYWLSLPLWVLLDAREYGDYEYVWALFVLIGNLVALIAYLLARQPKSMRAYPSSKLDSNG